MIVVLLGPDRLLVQRAQQELVTEYDPDGFNTAFLDAVATPADALLSAVSTPPFMGDHRLVFVSDRLAGFKAKQDSDLATLCESVLENVVLVLTEPGLSALPAGAKAALGSSAIVRTGTPPRGSELVDWVEQRAELCGSGINSDAARKLLDRLFPGSWKQAARNAAFDHPPDLQRLGGEVEKLSTAAAPGPITGQLIEELVSADFEEQAFALQDAVMRGDRGAALRQIAEMGLTRDEAPRVLATLYQQIEYARAANASGRPNDNAAAGKQLGMTNPNRFTMVLRGSTRSNSYYDELLTVALETDRRIKNGNEPDPLAAIHYLIESLPQTQ